ncbi:type II toxin-antitoxin system death-on-curing family toxin, partial [Listeria monocytogenes]|nr:type II toxin-antitoxin system death-on-curing family toxin [Listeria monocytogenes]
SQTGSYDLSKLNFATVSRMRKTLGKASATDTTIYDFASYSKVKQGGMWILSKDGKVDIKATEAYNTASFNGELPKESNQATEEGELLKATLESLKQNKDPITGQEISKAQSFGILTSLVFGYTTKVYRGKKFTIPKSALKQANRANIDQKTHVLKNIEASKKAREASNFEEHLKREKVALEEINKGGSKQNRNLVDDMKEIAGYIRNINRKYSNGFEQNNSIDSIINSASYYNDAWEQTSAVTRSIADHAFENGNKRTAFDTLNMLLDDFNLKSPLTDSQKWDLIEKLGRKEITDVSKITNIIKGK